MGAVCEVISGFREERPLLQAKKIGMYDWMKLRVITISGQHFLRTGLFGQISERLTSPPLLDPGPRRFGSSARRHSPR